MIIHAWIMFYQPHERKYLASDDVKENTIVETGKSTVTEELILKGFSVSSRTLALFFSPSPLSLLLWNNACPAAEVMCCRQPSAGVHSYRSQVFLRGLWSCSTENSFKHSFGGILFSYSYCVFILHLSPSTTAVVCCSWYTAYLGP